MNAFLIFLSLLSQPGAAPAPSLTGREEQLAKVLEAYYLKPEMRSPEDRIQIEGSKATIRLWRDLPPDPQADKIECLGYQWLLAGRGQHIGDGAKEVFKAYPELESLSLEFVELEFRSKSVDGRGKLQKQMLTRRYLSLTAERATLLSSASSDSQKLKQELQQDTPRCLKLGRSLISKKELSL